MSETAKFASVVLPGASFFEKSGTFTNGERRVQRVNEVIPPLPGTKTDGRSCLHHEARRLRAPAVAGIAVCMSVRLAFNERKATQAAAHLLRLHGGRMSCMKLIKLLYLADREALLTWGRPISTDRYVSMDRGPVLSRVLDLATDGGDPGTPSIWASSITEPSNYECSSRRKLETTNFPRRRLRYSTRFSPSTAGRAVGNW